jgi:hypothetical protein
VIHSINWRGLLAALPLPMLALAASYGVYQYALLFVPAWVAITQASAFEATYLGLAALTLVSADQRRRAGRISVGAVIVSILYNSLAGLFHRQPGLLVGMPLWGDVILATLHGAPLAWVAYLVSDLLLHRAPVEAPAMAMAASIDSASGNIISEREPASHPARDYTCRHCGQQGLTSAEIMAHGRIRKAHGTCPGHVASAAD